MHRTGPLPLALALLASLGAPWASAAVVDATTSGFTLENSREVPVDAGTAWKALVEDVDRWWPKDHTWWGNASTLSIDPRAGGCFCERVRDSGDGREAQHLTVTFVEPGKLMRMVGGLGPLQGMGLHGVLEWRIVATGESATRITLWYRAGGYAPDDLSKLAPVVDRVQAAQLGALADFLAAQSGKRADE